MKWWKSTFNIVVLWSGESPPLILLYSEVIEGQQSELNKGLFWNLDEK